MLLVALAQLVIGTVNDICDQALDARYKPWRPIPSGRVTTGRALALATTLFASGLTIGLHFGSLAVLGFVGMTCVGLLYDIHLKVTLLSWLPVSVGYGIHLLWTLAMTGQLTARSATFPLCAFPLTIGIHIANQLPDIGEAEAGVRGLTHRLGGKSKSVAFVLLMCAPVALALACPYPQHNLPLLLAVGLIPYGLCVLLWLRLSNRPTTPPRTPFLLLELGTILLLSTWAWSLRPLLPMD